MSKPHGYKKNISIKPNSIGVDRRQEWSDDIHGHSGFQPIGISLFDIDKEFVNMVKNELKILADIIIDEKTEKRPIPVLFLTAKRWAEFSRTWEFTNELKEISLPFITIVRKPDVQVGTGQNGFYNIPGRRNWTYYKVPTFEGGRKGIDLYKIPQPTSVDVSFEVRMFSNKLKELNSANEIILTAFDSIQKYINVKGHPMGVNLDSNTDESTINDFENRRMYINMYDMLVKGYILNEKDFEVVSTIDRIIAVTEIAGEAIIPRMNKNKVGSNSSYEFIFKCINENEFSFNIQEDVSFFGIIERKNISEITFLINNVESEFPFNVITGDHIKIIIEREDENKLSKFKLLGNNVK